MIYAWITKDARGRNLDKFSQYVVAVETEIQGEVENIMEAMNLGRGYFLLKDFRANDLGSTPVIYVKPGVSWVGKERGDEL